MQKIGESLEFYSSETDDLCPTFPVVPHKDIPLGISLTEWGISPNWQPIKILKTSDWFYAFLRLRDLIWSSYFVAIKHIC